MTIILEIIRNPVLFPALVAWLVAQTIKVLLHMIFYGKIDYSRFIGSGGMPSSHSAFVMSLSVSIGLIHGWASTYFAISLALAFIVMYDAAGVRRAAGKQAAVLNDIIEEIQANRGIPAEKLKELIGHTPVEVIAGAILGVIISLTLT